MAVAASLTAGFCEVLYRGFFCGLMTWVPAQPPWNLAVIFGGRISTRTRGVIKHEAPVFGVAYLLTGSLWVPILLHATVDVTSLLTTSIALEDGKGSLRRPRRTSKTYEGQGGQMRPRVIVHNEISVDGRMDFYAGDMGLYYEIAGRLGADASLAGSETIIKGMAQFGDDISEEPEQASPPAADRPLFAVVDSRGRIDQWPLIQKQPYWGRIVVLCSEATPRAYLDGLRGLGIDYIVHGPDRVDLAPSLEEAREPLRREGAAS